MGLTFTRPSQPFASVARMSRLVSDESPSVPDSVAVLASHMSGATRPPVALHVYGPVPPLAVNVCA